MKVIAGLGNPGREYTGTRHNIGFHIVEQIARAAGIEIEKKKFKSLGGRGKVAGTDVILALPQTYMNLSGEAVRQWMDFYKIDNKNLLVVHDELDLNFGKMKLSFDSSAAGHNGVASIIENLGTKEFSRLRFGVGKPTVKDEGADHVLSSFSKEEKTELEGLTQTAVDMIHKWLVGSIYA
jgi:peptidyl-tRNA hydrolase, PTH1 family